MRWLGLPRCECELYADKDGGYLPAVRIADTLAELVRTALRTGEITFVEGPEAAMEELELRDSGILRALRVVFRADPTLPVTMDFPGDLTVPPLTAEETSGSDPAPARSARRAADPRPALISGAFDRDDSLRKSTGVRSSRS